MKIQSKKDLNLQITNHFTQNLSRLMKEEGIKTDSELFNALGISQSRFSLIKNGKAMPLISEVFLIACYFDVPIDSLVNPVYEKSLFYYRDITYRDLLRILIELSLEKDAIEIIEGYTLSDLGCCPSGEYGIRLKNDSYLNEKLSEWIKVMKPLTKLDQSDICETIDSIKSWFLNNVSDDYIFKGK